MLLQVWLGKCKTNGKKVALKLLDLDSGSFDLVRASACCTCSAELRSSTVTCSATSYDMPAHRVCTQELVIKETQTMHDQRHPHLLPLYASFVSFNHLWMVMPFIEGGSALDVLQASFREVGPSAGLTPVLLSSH